MEEELDSTKLLDQILAGESFDPVYRVPLNEALKVTAVRAALKSLILLSDDTLKNIGMTDLTDPIAIQKGLRAQGVVEGLTLAVETIVAFATTLEEKTNANK